MNYLIIISLFISLFQSKPSVIIAKDSNTEVHHPYNGKEPITFIASGLTPNVIYNMVIPTNYAWGGVMYECAEQIVADSKGMLRWTFNNNPNADYLKPIYANNWNLSDGKYQFRILLGGKPKDICSTSFTIIK